MAWTSTVRFGDPAGIYISFRYFGQTWLTDAGASASLRARVILTKELFRVLLVKRPSVMFLINSARYSFKMKVNFCSAFGLLSIWLNSKVWTFTVTGTE